MAYLLANEKKMINGNIFKYEERLNSQYTRFLEKTPSFVTYYHINNIESTVDNGFQNVNEHLGPNSPLRFNKVFEFPIYGLEQIILSLSADEGMDTEYEGEATILPNTIQPYPDDYFIVEYLDNKYVFRVTAINYDTIKSNNFYQINFTLKSLTGSDVEDLERQTNAIFRCIFENIGTQEKCLIQEDEIGKLIEMNAVYTNIAELYKILFYNQKFNSFMWIDRTAGTKMYDKYMSQFINQFGLFNQKNNFETLYLNVENTDPLFILDYHNSIYRALELGRKEMITSNLCRAAFVNTIMSIFAIQQDRTVREVTFDQGTEPYLPETLMEKIQTGTVDEGDLVSWKTIVSALNGKITTIYELDLETLKNYTAFMTYDIETFRIIPILLFVLRNQYTKFMTVK